MLKAIRIAIGRGATTWIETGCYRGSGCDGWSTLVFAMASEMVAGARMLSCDINADHVRVARELVGRYKHAEVVLGDSVAWLATLGMPVGFLYLDSRDFEVDNPMPAQEHQLAEVMAVAPYLTDQTVVLLDDHKLINGGKTALSVPALQGMGFSVADEGYQALMLKSGCIQ